MRKREACKLELYMVGLHQDYETEVQQHASETEVGDRGKLATCKQSLQTLQPLTSAKTCLMTM